MRKPRLKQLRFRGLIAALTLAFAACGTIVPTPLPADGQSNVENEAIASPAPPNTPSNSVATEGPQGVIGCAPPAEPAPAMTEGPYFKPDSPERRSLLESGLAGDPLVVSGFVLTTACEPIAGARLDFWQADGAGRYDNSGYRLRGHQFTDAAGWYELITVMPALYGGRTAHIHVKVQPPGWGELTTQIFFPNVAQNQTDPIFNEALVVDLLKSGAGWTGRFNFILRAP